jgi:RNA-directed DNA polymerase
VSLQTPEKLQKLQRTLYAKAKREPNYRFYLLYDKVYREDILAHAYALCRSNRGAPGVDGQTFGDIEAYGRERWLGELREEVRTGRYKPKPVRRVMIPKPGGVGQRPLGIPTVRDRVVQTAAKLVLEPIFEADFDEAAHGYRPRRSATDAVRKVHKALIGGRTEVIDADLSRYFDEIPHSPLMKCVARRVSDRKMLKLVKSWLKVPVEERDERGRKRYTGGKRSTRGTPQGGVISPLLANIYMHRYIKAFRKHGLDERHDAELVNYADDFVVLCRRDAKGALETTRRWMANIGLRLNETKTRTCDARREPFDFLGYTFGPRVWPVNGRRYTAATPSKKAVRRLRERVRGLLSPGNQDPWPVVATTLNRILRGWANYFRYGTLSGVRRGADRAVYDRTRHFLRRRHKLASRGTRQLSWQRVFGELGVLSLQTLPRPERVNALA